MLSNQIRAVFAGRFCLGEGEEEEEREKSNERRVNRVDTFSRDERFRGRGNSSPNFRDKGRVLPGEERSFGEIREIGRFRMIFQRKSRCCLVTSGQSLISRFRLEIKIYPLKPVSRRSFSLGSNSSPPDNVASDVLFIPRLSSQLFIRAITGRPRFSAGNPKRDSYLLSQSKAETALTRTIFLATAPSTTRDFTGSITGVASGQGIIQETDDA